LWSILLKTAAHIFWKERRKCESYRNGCISDQSEVNYGRGNPLCTGNDRRIYDHADPDSKGTFASREIVLEELLLLLEKKNGARCVSFESHAYINLGYEDEKSLGPGEIVAVTPEGIETLQKPGDKMRICSFLWVYYGYPTSTYEGVNVGKCAINAAICWQSVILER